MNDDGMMKVNLENDYIKEWIGENIVCVTSVSASIIVYYVIVVLIASSSSSL